MICFGLGTKHFGMLLAVMLQTVQMTLHGSRSSNVLLNRLTCSPFITSNEYMDEAGKTQSIEQRGQITVDMSQVLVLAVIFGLLRQ